MNMVYDCIEINEIKISTYLGVPDEEREKPQLIHLSAKLFLHRDTIAQAARNDDVLATVDYAKVCDTLIQEVHDRPRKLLETLAEELSAIVFEKYPLVQALDLRLTKFILPCTRDVTLCIYRDRS
jgi:dihydroneopterin aldolase